MNFSIQEINYGITMPILGEPLNKKLTCDSLLHTCIHPKSITKGQITPKSCNNIARNGVNT